MNIRLLNKLFKKGMKKYSEHCDPTLYWTAGQATDIVYEDVFDNSVKEMSKAQSFPSKTKFALLVGIITYGEGANLRGCLNDVKNIKNLLTSTGWSESNIRTLVEEQATRSNVIDGIKWLISNRKKDDVLIFYFSKYGSWTLTPEGIGWECCICCSDCASNWDGGVIARTQFNNALKRTSGSLTVMLDSCFSGGMGRRTPPYRKLLRKVRKLLYGSNRAELNARGVRALPGPEWDTLEAVSKRFNESKEQLLLRIREGILETREVLGGHLHVRI